MFKQVEQDMEKQLNKYQPKCRSVVNIGDSYFGLYNYVNRACTHQNVLFFPSFQFVDF